MAANFFVVLIPQGLSENALLLKRVKLNEFEFELIEPRICLTTRFRDTLSLLQIYFPAKTSNFFPYLAISLSSSTWKFSRNL